MSFKINKKGFWETEDESGHCFDQPLCENIKNIVKKKSLLDLGCGTGAYTKELQNVCVSAKGYDGNPNTYKISKGLCNVADLSKKQEFDKVDWILSLEVGEHIPKEFEDVLLDNICSHSTKGVILSWAVPGQPGDGHVNCQSNDYIIDKMLDQGFIIDWDLSFQLRESATLWWFKDTIMCFKKSPIPKSTNSIEKITFCIPSKSNVRYLKTCIPSIRENAYRNDHDIIIFVDSDEDGTLEWLDSVKDEYNISYYVNPDLGNSLYGIGKAYDYCIAKSTTDIFMIFHADMMLGKHADLKAFKFLKPKTVVCSTRIEPPLHPNNGEKILIDFGVWPEEFKQEKFNDYVNEHLEDKKVTEGIFAPWMMYKEEFLSIGGHDPTLHSCREDSDIFNRMLLGGFNFTQPWNSLVYHLTGRGAGSFDGDSERHKKWQEDMNRSTKEFIRKWGSNVEHDNYMKPIVTPKYDIGFQVTGCNSQLLEMLEPWCSTMLIDDEMQVLTSYYLDGEQKNTTIDLSSKIKSTPFEGSLENDIIIKIDKSTFTSQDFQLMQQLPQIIKDSGEVGEFELGNLKIKINSLEEYQNDLINL